MAIRVYKPTTAGRRNASVSDFSELTRTTPEKSLVRKLSKTGGRNSYGRMTSRHRGGGHKRQYRLIDFKRWDKDGVPAKVAHIEYDPNRTARIALLHYADGEKRYIIAPEGIKQGDTIETGEKADIKPGNNLPLKNIPTGTIVHAIELRPLGGAKIARSAGAAVQLVAKDGAYAQLRMPSGEIRNVDARCRATIGEVGNSEHANIQLGKAGRARWMGKRPWTRGESMNPVDHPHGGRTRGGKPPVSPWGKGEVRTRRPKKASNKMIVRRHVRVTPRKARRMVDLIRGKKATEAVTILKFAPQAAALPVRKVLESAIANARVKADKAGEPFRENDLVVKTTYVDEGVTLKRFRARAQGRAARINKRTSHITVIVANKEGDR